METTKLVIKYKDKYICDKVHNEIEFIWIPPYDLESDFLNVDVFVSLLCSGNMNNSYEASRRFDYSQALSIFEKFFLDDCIYRLDDRVFLYDLDKLLEMDGVIRNECEDNLRQLPGTLVLKSYEELLDESLKEDGAKQALSKRDDEEPFLFGCSVNKVDLELLRGIASTREVRQDNDCLLLYSGGKDSTLAAIRLKNAGYNVHFVHYSNGHMLDDDKPFLTFKKTFANYDGYTFHYQNKAIPIADEFNEYFSYWKNEHGDNFDGGNLDSEIRCLSCRMAMYTKAIIYAKEHGFKYIAEGARISQKFMLEQIPVIERLKVLASNYGIELLFPVLDLVDDELEKQELIANGFSSKGWESKCLLGRAAMDKSVEDERIILEYFDNILSRSCERKIAINEGQKRLIKE